MWVKSLKAKDHINHLIQTFNVLEKYLMHLDRTKCTLGISARKFLGLLVTQWGIEAKPDQIRALIDMKSPKSKKGHTKVE